MGRSIPFCIYVKDKKHKPPPGDFLLCAAQRFFYERVKSNFLGMGRKYSFARGKALSVSAGFKS